MRKNKNCGNLNFISINQESKKNNDSKISFENQKPLHPESRRDMRSLAFHFIYAVDRFNYTIPIETVINNFKKGFNLEVPNDSLAVIMATGTTKMRNELDDQIKPLLKNWKFERLGCCTRLILRLALWEMRQPDAIPSIVINEAIELAKAFAEKDSYKFINGLLDEASKKMQLNNKEKKVDKNESTTSNNKPTEKQ